MRKTRPVQVKHIQIGGGAPVAIQSMTKTDTADVGATVAQIEEMIRAGCDTCAISILSGAHTSEPALCREWIVRHGVGATQPVCQQLVHVRDPDGLGVGLRRSPRASIQDGC